MLEPLAPDAVLLHVGAPKTGTTALQSSLVRSRGTLRELGVLVPGSDISHNRHVWQMAGYPDHPLMQPDGENNWPALVEQVRSWPGRVVISAEVLFAASHRHASRILEELDSDRVTVLITARPPAYQVTSVWQEYLKCGGSVPLADWLRHSGLESDIDAPDDWTFLLHADYAALAHRWSESVGPDRVVVHINNGEVDSGATDLLAYLLGVPRGLLRGAGRNGANPSLTWPEAEVLRRINAGLSAADSGMVVVSRDLISTLVNRVPADNEPRLGLEAPTLDLVARWTAGMIEALRESGVQIHGDPDLLLGAPIPREPSQDWSMPGDLTSLMRQFDRLARNDTV